jgi:hypothetical protein
MNPLPPLVSYSASKDDWLHRKLPRFRAGLVRLLVRAIYKSVERVVRLTSLLLRSTLSLVLNAPALLLLTHLLARSIRELLPVLKRALEDVEDLSSRGDMLLTVLGQVAISILGTRVNNVSSRGDLTNLERTRDGSALRPVRVVQVLQHTLTVHRPELHLVVLLLIVQSLLTDGEPALGVRVLGVASPNTMHTLRLRVQGNELLTGRCALVANLSGRLICRRHAKLSSL